MKEDPDHTLQRCPVCGKCYLPDLDREDCTIPWVQATPIQREQIISGICSDECWDRLFGDDALCDALDDREIDEIDAGLLHEAMLSDQAANWHLRDKNP